MLVMIGLFTWRVREISKYRLTYPYITHIVTYIVIPLS